MDIVSSGLNIDSGRLYAYAASAAKLLPPDGETHPRAELRRLERQLSHDLDAAEGRQAYLTTDCQTGA